MQIDFQFKNVNDRPLLRSYAEKAIHSRLKGLVREPVWVDMIFSVERAGMVFRCYVYTGDGMSYCVKQSSENMQKSVDMAADKLVSQLRRPIISITKNH